MKRFGDLSDPVKTGNAGNRWMKYPSEPLDRGCIRSLLNADEGAGFPGHPERDTPEGYEPQSWKPALMGAAAVDNPTACGDRKHHLEVAGITVSKERVERKRLQRE
jgi:hypothetical protein